MKDEKGKGKEKWLTVPDGPFPLTYPKNRLNSPFIRKCNHKKNGEKL